MCSEDDRLYDEANSVFSFLQDPELYRNLTPLLLDIIDSAFAVVSQFCPAIEPIRGLLQMFKPDLKHEEIMNAFDDLKLRLEDLKYDWLRAKRNEAWQHAKTRITGAVRDVENCVRVVCILRDGVPETSLDCWRHELSVVGRPLNAALMHLFKSMSQLGKDRPLNDDIFQCYYEYVQGDRHMVENMVSTTLQLIVNGLTAFCVYKAHRHGNLIVTELFQRYQFRERFIDVANSAGQSLSKCLTEYPQNMMLDVKDIFHKNKLKTPNVKLTDLAELFYKKYYWLETFCMLYLPKQKTVRDVDFEPSEGAKAVGIDVVDKPVESDVGAVNCLFISDLNDNSSACSHKDYRRDIERSRESNYSKNEPETNINSVIQIKSNVNAIDTLDSHDDSERLRYITDIHEKDKSLSGLGECDSIKDVASNNGHLSENMVDSGNLSEISRSKCIVFARETAMPSNNIDSKNHIKKVRKIIENISRLSVKKAKQTIQESLRRENIDNWGIGVVKIRNLIGLEVATVCRTSLANADKLVWMEKNKLLVCVLLK